MAAVYRRAGEWTDETIGGMLTARAASHPSALAVATVDGTLTYEALDGLSNAVALSMAEAGLVPGDAVLFQMGNELETVVAWYGVLKAGLIPVCSIPNLGVHEMSHIARATGARAHIFQHDYRSYDLAAVSDELARHCSDLRVRIVARGPATGAVRSMEEMVGRPDASEASRFVSGVAAAASPDAAAVFQLSGGTTGIPKVIPHLHATYLSAARRWSRNLAWDGRSVNLHFLPLMHHAGLGTVLTPTHLVGGTAVLARAIDAELLAGLIEQFGVSWMHFNLAAFGPLRQRSEGAGCDFSSVTHFSWTFVRPQLAAQAEKMLGAVAVGSFGMGEGVHLSARRDDPEEVRLKSVGGMIGPLDEVVVRRPGEDEPVPDGEIGELTFRGPSVIRSYLDPHDTAASFTTDGFLRSGDLGRAMTVGDCRVHYVDGRLKDQISRGGEKFMALELEELLLAHGAVREVAAVGIPDERLGERVCVVVVPEGSTGDSDPEELRKELVEFLASRGVAKFKWPERLELVPELPKTAIGKVMKDSLRRSMAGVVPTCKAGDQPAT